ncbi:MAG: hypothetical protein HFJ53_06065 [Clostridia bacterium]|jgi:hypothetical protein|nr:hypothetical protein [Clostridia bacterium]
MEENKEEKLNELKQETVQTVNQVKDTIKNVDIKNDAKAATGFVSAMFKDPFAKIKEICTDSENKNFKIAIIFISIWLITIFVEALIEIGFTKFWSVNYAFSQIWRALRLTFAPLISILVISLIIFIMNKKAKKSMTTIITSITIAQIPTILARIISMLNIISLQAATLTNRISQLGNVVSIILLYFTMKSLFEEEKNSKFIKTFIIIEAIYYTISLVIYYLGIYI